MATPFAALEARLGSATRAAFSNATALVLPSGPQIDGVFDRPVIDTLTGATGFQARAVTFGCGLAEADAAGVVEGTKLQIAGSTWAVALRSADPELGEVEFDLTKATP